MRKILLLIAMTYACNAGAQSLSALEKKITGHIDEDLPRHIELLKNSVDINSGTFNKAGVKAVGMLYAEEFKKLGFTVEWIDLPDSLNRAGHLVAWRKGNKGKKLFLVGHLDTVFEPDMPPNPFRMINDSTATGQGVNDMKGGDVIIIAALSAMHKEGLLDGTTITVYMTGDEEKSGKPTTVSRYDFIQRAKQHDLALAFEGANGLNTAAIARRGIGDWRIEVTGKQGHSSQVFGRGGYGSVYEAVRIINEFRLQLGKEKYLTLNPGLIMGGSEMQYDTLGQKGNVTGKTNIISPQTVAIGDLRYLSPVQRDKGKTVMQKIVSTGNLPGSKAWFRFREDIPAMPPTKGNEALLKKLSEVSLALGYGPVIAGDPAARGAGDISHIAQYMDCIDGLGSMGAGEHAPGETTNLKVFPKLAKRAALLIYRLTR